MPIAFVKTAKAPSPDGQIFHTSSSVAITPAAGNLLVLTVVSNKPAAAAQAVTDNNGSTWTKAAEATTAEGKNVCVWFLANCPGTATTITASVSGFEIAWALIVQEFSGIATTSARDVIATALDSGYVQTHNVGPSSVTSQADELVIVSYASGTDESTDVNSSQATFSAGTGYSNAASQLGGHDATERSYVSAATASKIVNVTGAQSGSITTNAYDKGAMALVSFRASTAPTTPPATPTNVAAAGGDGSISVSWQASANATGYKVYRSATSGGSYSLIASPTGTSYSNTGLINGTTYFYKVSATNAQGESLQSAAVSATATAPVAVPFGDWHPYGSKPNLTTAYMRGVARAKADAWLTQLTSNYTINGSPSPIPQNPRLPGPVKRIAINDQVIYPQLTTGGTVSESSYANIFLALLSNPALDSGVYKATAKDDFDACYRFFDSWKNERGLPHWNIDKGGFIAGTERGNNDGRNGAADGDFDLARGLYIMERVHGNAGAINYALELDNLLKSIEDYEFVPETGYAYPNLQTNGDGWGFNADNFMVDYMRVGQWRTWSKWLRSRGEIARADRWLRIIDANLDHAAHYAEHPTSWTAGVPDRQTRTFTQVPGFSQDVTYNSVRLGFGWMVEYLWHGPNGDPRARAYMAKIAARFKAVFGTGGNVKAPSYSPTLSLWNKNGDGTGGVNAGGYTNLSGFGYALSIALGEPENQTLTTELFTALANIPNNDYATSYFNGGIAVYALMQASGLDQEFELAQVPDEEPPPPPPDPEPEPTYPPGQVTGLGAGSITQTSIPLTWSAVTGATDYVLERSSSANGTFTAIYTGAGRSYTNSGLSESTTYFYRVKAVNSAGSGAYSSTLQVTTAAPAPSTVTATAEVWNGIAHVSKPVERYNGSEWVRMS